MATHVEVSAATETEKPAAEKPTVEPPTTTRRTRLKHSSNNEEDELRLPDRRK